MVDGLSYDDISTSIFARLIALKVMTNIAKAKVDESGIHLLAIIAEKDSYSVYAYYDLFYFDEVLYQVANINDESTYDTVISSSYCIKDI